jgi:lysozyme
MSEITGIDVSHWQGRMDWTKALERDVDFAYIRAGSIDNQTGRCYEDYQFQFNAAHSPTSIKRGFYWFFRPNHNALVQVEYFASLIQHQRMELPPVCDIEVAGDAGPVEVFCRHIRKRLGDCMIYTNANTFGTFASNGLLKGDKTWAAAYPLWVADWTAPVNLPYPWKSWAIWQYSAKGDGPGYGASASKSIDLNRASPEWWQSIAAPDPDPTPALTIEQRLDRLEAWAFSQGMKP